MEGPERESRKGTPEKVVPVEVKGGGGEVEMEVVVVEVDAEVG